MKKYFPVQSGLEKSIIVPLLFPLPSFPGVSLILGRLFLAGEVSRGQAKFQEPCVLRIVFHFGPPDMEVTVPHSRGTDSPTT